MHLMDAETDDATAVAPRQGEADLLDAMLGVVRGIDRVHASGILRARSGVMLERGLHPVVMTIHRLQPVRTTDLAAALALNSSTVSRHLARLEELGLVQREVDPADGRASRLVLSAAGRRTRAELLGAWEQVLSEQLAAAGSGDAGTLAVVLNRLVAALELIPADGDGAS